MVRLVGLLLLLLSGIAGAQQIAITLDDAPMPDTQMTGLERTAMLIDGLKSARVDEVMFFVTSQYLEEGAGSERLRDYVRSGHLLANHTHSHPWLHQSDPDDYEKDVLKAHNLLKEFEGYHPYFRFPFLDEGRDHKRQNQLRGFLAQHKLRHGYVTASTFDWHINDRYQKALEAGRSVDMDKLEALYVELVWESIQHYEQLALEALERSPKHVLLLHENDLAARFVPALVAHIRAQGWEIISPLDAYTDPLGDDLPDTLYNGDGRIVAVASTLGYSAERMRNPAESIEYIDQRVDAAGVFQ